MGMPKAIINEISLARFSAELVTLTFCQFIPPNAMKIPKPLTRTVILMAIAATSLLRAAPDTLDTIFAGTAGTVYRNNEGDFGSVASMLVLPDGKILVGSNEMAATLDPSGELFSPLLRFNADGTVDETFFADDDVDGERQGIVFEGDGWPEVMALGRQSDGKIIAAGVMTGMNDDTNEHESRNIVRINTDGRVDTTFQTAGTQQWISFGINYINHLIVEPNDKVLIAGGFRGVRNSASDPFTTRHGIARLNANGSLDTTFALNLVDFGVFPGVMGSARVIIYQAERDAGGNYYIVGSIGGTGPDIPIFARLFPDGSRDFSFTPVLPEADWNSVAIDRLGRITVTGLKDFSPMAVHRVFPDGSVDPSFTPPAALFGAMAQPLEIDGAGRFYYTTGAQLRRVLADGSIDSAFTATASWANWDITPSFNLATTAPDGTVYAGGFFDNVNGNHAVKFVRFEGNPVADAFLLASSAVQVSEAAGVLHIGVSRVGAATGAASIDLATANGTALAGMNFTATSGTLTWAAGETGTKFLAIPILNNAAVGGDKNFSVNLTNAAGAPVSGPASATITILDDEAAPSIIRQPEGGTVDVGYSFTFSAAVSVRSSASFQWQRDTGAGFEDIPGATSTIFGITNATSADAGQYRLVVTTSSGSVTSDSATLVVATPPGTVLPLSIANFSSVIGNVVALATDADGRTLVMGTSGIRRLLADGTIDPAFSTTFSASSNGNMVVLPDGKILISGVFTTVNGQSRQGLARLNADGTLDMSFNANLGFSVRAMAVDATGRIYVGGLSNNGLFRYTSAGVLDSTFTATGIGTGGGFNPGAVYSINPRPDGTVLVGYRSVISGSSTNVFQRLLGTGAVDSSFTPPALSPVLSGSVEQSLVLPDGRIVIVGNFNQRILILGANGGIDSSFNLSHVPNASVLGVALADERLLVWGSFSQVGGLDSRGFARYFLDGTLDTAVRFGAGADGVVSALLVDADGNYLLGGSFSNVGPVFRSRLALILAGPPSAVFASISPAVVENAGPLTLTVRRLGAPDGEVSIDWATADGTAVAGNDYHAAAGTLVWADGDADDKTINVALIDNALVETSRTFAIAFSNPVGPIIGGPSATVSILDDDTPVEFTSQPQSVVVYAGSPITLTASATSPSAISYQWYLNDDPVDGATASSYTVAAGTAADAGTYFLRATNAAGSVDSAPADVVVLPEPAAVATDFSFGPTLNGNPEAIIPLPGGGALVGGSFTQVNGSTTRRYLIRVDANGALDANFTAVPNGNVLAGLRMPDGRILVAGDFTQISGTNAPRIAMINENGALDAAFMANLGTGANSSVNTLALTPQGRIVVGGAFSSVNSGSGTAYAAVINPDGTRDIAFSSLASSTVTAAAVQPDGKILLGGVFTYDSASRFVRVTPTGARDASFGAVISGSPTIRRIAVREDGTIFLAGQFFISSVNRSLISFTSSGAGPTADFAGSNGLDIAFLPGTSGDRLHLRGASPDYLWITSTDTAAASTFNSSLNFNNSVTAMALESGGAIWAGGAFTQFRGAPANRVVRLNGLPTRLAITSQPGLTSVDPGATINLSVGVTSLTTPSYQWYLDGVALNDDARISGATTATLTITGATAADEGEYTVEVVNATASKTSAPIPVYVTGEPRIVAMTADFTALTGNTVIIEAAVVGGSGMTYAWTRNGSPVVNGGNVSGAATPRLIITAATEANAGTYVLTATNPSGSDTAQTVVNLVPPPANRSAIFTGLAAGGNVNDILPLSGGRTLVATASGTLSGGLSSTSSTSRLVLIGPDRTISTPIANFTTTADAVIAMAAGPDEKIILRGGFTTIAGAAAPGLVRLKPDFSVDPTFAPAAPPAGSTALAVDSQGRVLIGGSFTNYAGSGRNYLVRLLPDGAIDTTFNPVLNGEVRRIKVLANDRVLVGSGIYNFLPSGHQAAILAANGSLETSFNVSGVNDVDADAAGNVYLALNNSPHIVRYSAAGVLDSAFSSMVPAFNSSIIRLRVQPNGRVVLMGSFSSPGTRIFRLNSDGSQDTSFQPGTGLSTTSLYSLALDAYGRIWLGGSFTQYQGSTANRLVALTGDPTGLGFVSQPLAAEVDPSGTAVFTVQATGTSAVSYQWFKDGVALADGGGVSGATTATLSIANVAAANQGSYAVVISNDSGSVESRAAALVLLGAPEFLSVPAGGAYEIAGTIVLSPVVRGASTLTYQWLRDGQPLSNNSVYSGASTATLTLSNPRESDGGLFTLVVTNGLGSDSADIPVTIFRNPTRINPDVPALTSLNNDPRDLILMPDGSRVLGGSFTSVGHTGGSATIRGLAFINPNGSAQTGSVQVYQTTSNGGVNSIAMDSQGRVYAGGSFSTSTQGTGSAVTVGRLIRATYNESLSRWERDTAYNIGTGANNTITRIVVDSAGRLLAGGSFTSFNGDASRQYLVRLLSDGSFDPAFTPAVTAMVTHVTELRDGRILAAGTNYLVCLLPNGGLDPTFSAGVSTNINTFEVLPDGRVLVARGTAPTLVLMESDGTVVPEFPAANSPTFSGSGTSAILPRPDGSILLGGVTNYDGQVINRMLLIDEAGVVLSHYDFESGSNGNPNFIRAARNGNIHIGGGVTTYQGVTVPRYAVLNGEPNALAILGQPAAVTLAHPGGDVTLIVDAVGTTALGYQWFKNGVPLTDGGSITGSQTANLSISSASAANTGLYTVEVSNESGSITSLPARVVVGAPVADSAPPSRTILVGGSIVIGAPVFGPEPLTYAWKLDGVPLSNGSGVSGADTPFLALSNAQLSASGEYTLTVTNAYGTATSPPGTLIVINNPAGIASGFAGLTINGSVNAILPMPEGRVLIGGSFSSASDGVHTSGARLAVVNPDGTLHPAPGLSADNTVNRLAIDSSGRPLIAGQFENVHSTPRRRVARLNADFTLDASFDATPVFYSHASAAEDVFEEASGSIMVTGSFTNTQMVPTSTSYAVRLTASGAHDPSFTSGASFTINRSFPQSDGGLVFIGNFWNYDNQASGGYAVKTLANGRRDATFAFQTLSDYNFSAGTRLADGSLIVNANSGIIRFNPDGTRDAGFGLNGVTSSQVYHQDADGRILSGGGFTTINGVTRNRIIRTTGTGVVDPLFVSGTGFDSTVRAITTAADGSIWIGGDFSTFNGTTVQRLVRLNGGPNTLPPPADPEPEPFDLAEGFVPNTGFNSAIFALASTPDGGVFAGGSFIDFGGEEGVDRLVKVLPDGSRDPSFTPAPGLGLIHHLIRQPDGKVLALGSLAGHPSALLRFLPDGSLDAAFHTNLGTAENGDIHSIDLQPDGRILLGGSFFGWNSITFPQVRHLVRLNPDGTFQASEPQPDAVGSSFTVVRHLPDGRILLTYMRSGGSNEERGRRLRPDLSRDYGFALPSATPGISRILVGADNSYMLVPADNNPVRKVTTTGAVLGSSEPSLHTAAAIQNSGDLLVGRSNGLFRYDLDLETDPSFVVSTNQLVRAIAIRPDGRIWIGGSFTQVNGQPVPYLALLAGDPADEIESWFATSGIPLGLRGDLDDADGNGVPNLIEYLYQTNPMNPADRPEPNLGNEAIDGAALAILTGDPVDPAKTYRIFSFDVPKNTLGLSVSPQVSADLADFNPASLGSSEILPRIDNGSNEIRRYYITTPVEELPSGFMRLGISR